MNCPLCVDEVLDVTHHGGVEIDVCPRCRGIWLDRGELDRLMGPAEPTVATPAPSSGSGHPQHDFAEGGDGGGGSSKKSSKKNKKRRLMDKLGDALEEVLDL